MSGVDPQALFGPEIELDRAAGTTSPGDPHLRNCSVWRWDAERAGETCLMASHAVISGISLVGPHEKPPMRDQAGGI